MLDTIRVSVTKVNQTLVIQFVFPIRKKACSSVNVRRACRSVPPLCFLYRQDLQREKLIKAYEKKGECFSHHKNKLRTAEPCRTLVLRPNVAQAFRRLVGFRKFQHDPFPIKQFFFRLFVAILLHVFQWSSEQ